MNTVQTWETISTDLENTLDLGRQIGRKLKGGEVIELLSDLGGGKTAFVRGLAAGMGSKDTVHSPSFTVSHEYRSGKLTLYHFDFHRLDDAGIVGQELVEILADPRAVVAVEWAGLVENILPAERLSIRFTVKSESERRLLFEYPKELSYLVPDET